MLEKCQLLLLVLFFLLSSLISLSCTKRLEDGRMWHREGKEQKDKFWSSVIDMKPILVVGGTGPFGEETASHFSKHNKMDPQVTLGEHSSSTG